MTVRVVLSQGSLSGLTSNYDMFGRRMGVCSNTFAVIAQNDLQRFTLHRAIFSPDYIWRWPSLNITYNQTDDFVQSVAVNNQQQATFVYIGENLNRTTQFIGIIDVNAPVELDRKQFNATYSSTDEYYQYYLSIDSQGQFAYVLGNDYSYIYDLNTYQLTSLPSYTFSRCLRPADFLVLDDSIHALVVGYSCGSSTISFFRSISLLSLQPPNSIYFISIETILPDAPEVGAEAFTYSPVNDLSMAVNDLDRVLVGVPMYNVVVFGSVANSNLTLDGSNISWSAGGAFGKSVAWLDNTSFAVLAYSSSGAPWASSQVFVFDVSSQWPMFSFPNNQQIISGLSLQSPSFLLLSASGLGDLAILLNSGELLALPSTPPGIYTACVIDSKTLTAPFYICTFAECPSGTYKPLPSIGLCYVCPPGTKNPKNSNTTDIECEPCASDAYCPLAAVDDVPNDPYTLRITQVLSYPESPDSTIFDDILIQNMFSLQINPPRCLLLSPLFWTLITSGLAVLIIAIAGAFQIFPGTQRHYFLIQRIFRQTDLVGEGELWIGGLFSFAIVVLVSFAYAFSNAYLSLYPIEQSSDAQLACDPTMRNAKFSTGVRLLSVPVAEEEAPMFNLLDTQPLTLSVDFLNTVPACGTITVIQRSGNNEIPLTGYTCSNTTPAIATVSLRLPVHELTITVTILQSCSIGALRICMTGLGLVQENIYTLRSLKFCEFIGTQNQTLSYTPEINVALTKVINKTQPLAIGGTTQLSGLFIPTIVTKGTSDEARYTQLGDYLRYLPLQSLITIELTETQFYLKNTQEPIARQAEVVFHALLFTIVVLELFGLIFLFFKLVVAPLFLCLVDRCSNRNRVGLDIDDDESLAHKTDIVVMKSQPQTSAKVSSIRRLTKRSVW